MRLSYSRSLLPGFSGMKSLYDPQQYSANASSAPHKIEDSNRYDNCMNSPSVITPTKNVCTENRHLVNYTHTFVST